MNMHSPLIELCNFFKGLCSKASRVSDLEHLESQIVRTSFHLERIFPPSFFDILVHLPLHLTVEAKHVRPIQYRWMYPIERYMIEVLDYHLSL